MKANDAADAVLRAKEGKPPSRGQCPFTGVAVPNVGGDARRYPIIMEQRECNDTCALFDAATGRNCIERVFAWGEEIAKRFDFRARLENSSFATCGFPPPHDPVKPHP